MLPKYFLAGLAAVLGVGFGRGAWEVTHNATDYPVVVETEQAAIALKPKTVSLMLYASPVWVVAPGAAEKSEATNGQEITVGTKVITGDKTRAAIVYPNGTATVLDSNSEAVLKEYSENPQKVVVVLEKNRIWSRVVKLLGEESYQTESSTVVATVRGTSYGHELDADGTTKILTREGLVEGNCKGVKQDSEVGQGLKTNLDCKSDRKIAPTTIKDSDKDEWYSFNEDEDKIQDYLRDNSQPNFSGVGIKFEQDNRGNNENNGNNNNEQNQFVDCVAPNGNRLRVTARQCQELRTIVTARNDDDDDDDRDDRRLTPTPIPTRVPVVPPTSTPVPLPPGEVFGDAVDAVSGTFGACCSDLSSDTGVAAGLVLGGPNFESPTNGFIQISDDSSVTIRFTNNRVVNRGGADLRIHTVDDLYPAMARIEVASGPDCGSADYKDIGVYADVTKLDLDIAGTGLSSVMCVRITDTVIDGDPYPHLGFDVDAIEAIHSEEVR